MSKMFSAMWNALVNTRSNAETADRSEDISRYQAKTMPKAVEELEEEFTRNPLKASVSIEALVDSQADRSEDISRYQAKTMPKARSSVEELEEEFTRNPLKASVSIEALVDSQGVDEDVGCEQNMKVEVCLPDKLAGLLNNNINKTHLILVADKSGSMSGNPWDQVRQAVLDVVNDNFGKDNILVDIVTYNHQAEHVVYMTHNYQQIFDRMTAAGGTDFNSAFLKVDEIITAQDEDFSRLVVIFLTDGCDTCHPNDLGENTQRWKERLMVLDIEVTVHAVGLSEAHNYEFLQSLRHIGSKKGIFRYCEPGSKPAALTEKIKDIYEVAASKSFISLHIKMTGEDKVIDLGEYSQIRTIPGQIIDSTPVKFLCGTWIKRDDSNSHPDMKMQLHINSGKDTVKIPLKIDEMTQQNVKLETAKKEKVITHLSLKTDILSVDLAKTIQSNKDIRGQVDRLIYLKLAKIPTGDQGRTLEVKTLMDKIVKNIKETVNTMTDIMDRYLDGEIDSRSVLATAQDFESSPEVRAAMTQKLQGYNL